MSAARAATLVCAVALAALLVAAAPASAFGLLPGEDGFTAAITDADGAPATGAATHPGAFTARVALDVGDGDLRDLELERPPGLVENPAVVGTCTMARFNTPRQSPFQEGASGESCPLDSQVGTLTVTLAGSGAERTFGLFNLVPPVGAPALLGAMPWGMPITFVPEVRSSAGAYRTALRASNLSQQLPVAALELTVWGHPWHVEHDSRRGDCLNELDPESGFGEPATLEKEPQTEPPTPPYYQPGTCSVGNPKAFPVRAYLTLPTSCDEPLVSRVAVTSWQQAGREERSFVHRDGAGDPLRLQGCEAVEPRLDGAGARPNSDRAAAPTGFEFELAVDQETLLKGTSEAGRVIPETRAPSQVRAAVVTLPPGMTVNPSLAAGLRGCSPAGFAAEAVGSAEGEGCPNESKIGEMIVQTPLFERQITGSVYLATPYDNPSGSLLGIYMVARAAERGVMVKLAGRVDADPADGRLVATFEGLPQLPYEHLLVRFRDGQRSPIATPPGCGSYSTRIALSFWSDPAGERVKDDPFELTRGIAGGACPVAPLPFAPAAQAGTANRQAGFFSPYFLRFTRTDAEQEITAYSTQLPSGLLGDISDVPFCPEAAIAAARGRDGFAEAADPSCPEAARIGRTVSGYGMGSVLAYAAGNLYLAGPYNGAPLSVVAVNPATVGPFDLGVIIVRSAIRIDPRTARVWIDSAGSDPIPHLMRGVPIHLRDVRVYIDRPGFTLNPTSCEPQTLTSVLRGSGLSVADPADDREVTVGSPFQVSFCSSLGFAPRISFRLKGGTRRGAYPSLRATVVPRPGDANIGHVTVTLPPSQFLAQENIRTICGRDEHERRECPAGSIYGWARAATPLLEVPLEGPVVLRASDNKLPDMVAQLSGRGIAIDVVGRIDAVRGRLRATYAVLPDAPVSRFVLTLSGGKRRGLLVNSDDICASGPASARMIGHNNVGIVRRPRLFNPACRKRAAKLLKRTRGQRSRPRQASAPAPGRR